MAQQYKLYLTGKRRERLTVGDLDQFTAGQCKEIERAMKLIDRKTQRVPINKPSKRG